MGSTGSIDPHVDLPQTKQASLLERTCSVMTFGKYKGYFKRVTDILSVCDWLRRMDSLWMTIKVSMRRRWFVEKITPEHYQWQRQSSSSRMLRRSSNERRTAAQANMTCLMCYSHLGWFLLTVCRMYSTGGLRTRYIKTLADESVQELLDPCT